MTAATKRKPDAFGSLLAALQALYEAEIERLVEVYRPRILAGEFSGDEPDGNGVKYLRLGDELQKTHPWFATERAERVVVAVSRYLALEPKSMAWDGTPPADVCMTHDILALAASRGWVKRYPHSGGVEADHEPYALRVA